MRLGYACINTSIPQRFRTCREETFRIGGLDVIKSLTLHNLAVTYYCLLWNVENDIGMYRMSSGIVPFATHKEMTWKWWKDEKVLNMCALIKHIVLENNIRLSTHPGQYTLLNTPDEEKLVASAKDLFYHNILLNLCGGKDMILHVGGVYGDKVESIKRFINRYYELPNVLKEKLVIENDDKSYSLADIILISEYTGCKIVVDLHHDRCFPSGNIYEMFPKALKTWKDELPKIHISSGKTSLTDRSHWDKIREEDWLYFNSIIGGHDVDIMVEAKDKEKAVLALREIILKKEE